MADKTGKKAFFGDDEFEIPVVEETVPENPAPTQEQKPKKKEAAPEAITALADAIEKKPAKRTCGFYLSVESIQKLEKTAKQLKCGTSAVVDSLIKTYL